MVPKVETPQIMQQVQQWRHGARLSWTADLACGHERDYEYRGTGLPARLICIECRDEALQRTGREGIGG
jgi:hypothetical protein